jgi:hypothetical protein
MLHGKNFFWLNNTLATLRFRGDNRARLLSLSWVTHRGQDLPVGANPQVEFIIGAYTQLTQLSEGLRDTVTIRVPERIEELTLRCVNPVPENGHHAGGPEKRILMVGIADLKANFVELPSQ